MGFVESDEVVEDPLELLVDIFIGFRLVSRCRTIEDIVYAIRVVCSGRFSAVPLPKVTSGDVGLVLVDPLVR